MPSTKKKIKKVSESKNKNKNKVNVVVNVNSKNKNKSTKSSTKSGGGGGFGGGSNTVVNNVPVPVFMPPQNHQSFSQTIPQAQATSHTQTSAVQTAQHVAATAAQASIHHTPSHVIPVTPPQATPNLTSRVHFSPSVSNPTIIIPPQSHRSPVRIEEVGSTIHTPQHFISVNTPGGALSLSETARDRQPRTSLPEERSPPIARPIRNFIIHPNIERMSKNEIPLFNLASFGQRGFEVPDISRSRGDRGMQTIVPYRNTEIEEQQLPPPKLMTRREALLDQKRGLQEREDFVKPTSGRGTSPGFFEAFKRLVSPKKTPPQKIPGLGEEPLVPIDKEKDRRDLHREQKLREKEIHDSQAEEARVIKAQRAEEARLAKNENERNRKANQSESEKERVKEANKLQRQRSTQLLRKS